MKTKIKIVPIILSIIFAVSECLAQPITIPRTPSPAAAASQTIGISSVTVKYSRPSVKERKLWGELIPYGYGTGRPTPWRAGANENTTISFSDNAKVAGVDVPAGTYGLFFVINQDGSGEVILSKNYRSWGSFSYKPSEDLGRAKIQVRDNAFTELLTYDFINLTKNSAELVLNWEKKQFPVKIEFDVDKIVMANALEELRGTVGFGTQGLISAAQYSFDNNIDIEQGLRWVDRALVLESTNFNALRIKFRILVRMGKAEEADNLMKNALAIASESDINTYGYQLIGLGLHDKAIGVFVINTERFPKSANAWDSLGEAYATKGDKENAIKSFKKSLGLNPEENVKTNSEKFLKQFGAL